MIQKIIWVYSEMEVLCFRFLSKNIDKIVMCIHFHFNTASGLNYTNFERDLIKRCPQSVLNCSLEFTITSTSANCNRLHYFNARDIHKFSYRTIRQLIVMLLSHISTPKCKNP